MDFIPDWIAICFCFWKILPIGFIIVGYCKMKVWTAGSNIYFKKIFLNLNRTGGRLWTVSICIDGNSEARPAHRQSIHFDLNLSHCWFKTLILIIYKVERIFFFCFLQMKDQNILTLTKSSFLLQRNCLNQPGLTLPSS